MLNDQDRVFTNIYGLEDISLKGAKKRGDWSRTKSILAKGREKIIDEIKDDLADFGNRITRNQIANNNVALLIVLLELIGCKWLSGHFRFSISF